MSDLINGQAFPQYSESRRLLRADKPSQAAKKLSLKAKSAYEDRHSKKPTTRTRRRGRKCSSPKKVA